MRTHLWFVVLLAAAAGCQKTPAASSAAQQTAASAAKAQPGATTPAPAGKPAAPAEAPPKAVPAQLPPVIAHINGEDVTRDDLEQAVHGMEAQAGRPVPPEQRDAVYRGMLDQLVAFRLLRQETARRQMVATDAELEAAMKQVRGQFPTQAAFDGALKAQHLTLAQLRDETKGNLLISKMLDQEITPQLTVKPSDVSAFYEKNPDKFQQPETVRASHVLISVPQGADAATKAKAKATADDVLKQARAGADFGALAQKYSQDASKQRGGDLGFFPKGQMVPAFETAAWALQPGQLSEVVESPFGFHVIKVTERHPAQKVPFGDVSSRIEQYLQQELRSTKTREFVNGLKGKGKIEVLI